MWNIFAVYPFKLNNCCRSGGGEQTPFLTLAFPGPPGNLCTNSDSPLTESLTCRYKWPIYFCCRISMIRRNSPRFRQSGSVSYHSYLWYSFLYNFPHPWPVHWIPLCRLFICYLHIKKINYCNLIPYKCKVKTQIHIYTSILQITASVSNVLFVLPVGVWFSSHYSMRGPVECFAEIVSMASVQLLYLFLFRMFLCCENLENPKSLLSSQKEIS